MNLTFTEPVYLIFLLSIPLLIITHFYATKSTLRKAVQFSNFEALERVTGSISLPKNYPLLIIRILAIMSLIFALAGFTIWHHGQTSDTNFIIAIDASGSMLSRDIQPNRLEAAKQAATSFVESRTGRTKIGIISFAGIAYIEQRLTNSMFDVKNTINSISVKNTHGTAIGDALKAAIQILAVDPNPGALILITDGRETVTNKDNLDEIINYAKSSNLIVYPIGVGTKQGGLAEFLPSSIQANLSVDEATLSKIADATGGKFFSAENYDEILKAYEDIATFTESKIETKLQIPLVLLALLLVFIEWGLANTRFKLFP